MKKHLIPVMLVFSIITIAGCNSDSCLHCMVKDSQGDLIKDYDEKCGSSDDVEEYERSASEDAVQYGGTFECITH